MAITKDELDKYNAAYMQGNPIIDDATYDRLQEEYIQEHGEQSRLYTRTQQTGTVNTLTGTLSKCYGVTQTMRPEQKSYVEWVESKLGELYQYDNKPDPLKIIVQPKFDGCSVAYDAKTHQYFKRGDYDNGESEEVTHIFKDIVFLGKKRVDEMCDGCKFELIMSKSVHKDFPMYETPRDATAAMMKKGTIASYGTLIPLRELIDGKQYVSPELKEISMTTTLTDYDSIQRFITDLLNEGAVQEFHGDKYMCDGVVVSVIDNDDSIIKEVAIKILFDVHDAKLIDVNYQLGNTGKITPVAEISPTLVADGKRTVTNITLSNIKRIQDMQLRYNDTVRIMYNIVPYLIDSKHDGDYPINIPQKCPICGYKLDLSHPETVRCMNPECDGRRIGDITRYVIKMRMLGISKQTINRLYDAGIVNNIYDLYTLTKEKIMMVDGYKEKSAQNILDTIQIASQDCPVSRWLGALPFKDIDSKTWDIILNESFGNDELRKGNMIKGYLDMEDPEEFLYEIMSGYFDGIGDAKRRAINEGWLRNFKMMQEIIPYITFRITTVSKSKITKGYITFTGCRDESLVKTLAEKGYETIDFGSKTEYLIIPNSTYSNNKTAKAKAKGITLVTLEAAKNNFFE